MSRLWAFLNRDVRAFKSGTTKEAASPLANVPPVNGASLAEPLIQPVPEIASEVDPRQIEELRFRREVLDWRDEFHCKVTETATQAKHLLATQVDAELAKVNILQSWLFTKQASEVLKGHIEHGVQSPLTKFTQDEHKALKQHLLRWLPRHEPINMWIMWPKPAWDNRLGLKFTADNREKILAALDELILGKAGLAESYRDWSTQYAAQILEARHGRLDSL